VQQIPGAVRGLLLGTGLVWLVGDLRQSTKERPEAAKADRGSRLVLAFTIVAGFAAAIAVSRAATGAAIRPARVAAWVGLGILWCGMVLRLWCFRTLGRYFTLSVQTSGDQPVIATGPYHVLRHPSYAAMLLAVVGLGLFMANWLSLVTVTAIVTGGFLYRIRVEERALLQALGENYRAYADTRKRLVPFIW
jgi:protein-S-isoprenylcysteine O-methyltransferase Ste14